MASQYAILPELVRDSRLQAVINDSENLTVHTRPFVRRNVSRHETWSRKQILGHGGYGIVWLEQKIKEDDSPAELRAVKGIRIPDSHWKLEGGQYVRELEALAKFSQEKYTEFFVKSYGWYESAGWLYISMEYCEHGDLKRYLADVKTLPENQVHEIAPQILGALASMHESGFAHRDLKPANILIKSKPPTNDWWIKLCDFGLSKRQESVIGATTVKGTPGFMPPETIGYPFIGEPKMANPYSADMWCFGETLFQCLTGHATFEDMSELHRYQVNAMGFPYHKLQTVKASGPAANFIHSLMLPVPWQRLHIDKVGEHPWLTMDDDRPPALKAPIWSQIRQQEGVAGVASKPNSGPAILIMDNQLTQASGQWTTTADLPHALGNRDGFPPEPIPMLASPVFPEQSRPSDPFGSWRRGEEVMRHVYGRGSSPRIAGSPKR